uniref:Uncharacterized protein n=1 Tax=Electrophorus electricus TaxID=8005 RepID=A0AAY5EWY4_ELEEL
MQKAELRRKEQALRLLGKRLSQSQQEKQKLQQNINSAESALHMAAKRKDFLSSYMRSVELKDCLILSRFTTSKGDFILHLPRMHLDVPGIGGPEIAACQAMEVFQLACSRMASLEREILCHQSHVMSLKSELQEACLREPELRACEHCPRNTRYCTLHTLLNTSTHPNTLLHTQHTPEHFHMLQHTPAHFHTSQHTPEHFHMLQHTPAHS